MFICIPFLATPASDIFMYTESGDMAGAMETASLVTLYRCLCIKLCFLYITIVPYRTSLFHYHPVQGLALFRLGKLQKLAALQQEASTASITAAIESLSTVRQYLSWIWGHSPFIYICILGGCSSAEGLFRAEASSNWRIHPWTVWCWRRTAYGYIVLLNEKCCAL